MPTVFLSPSTQEYNAYYDGAGSEEYYMNRIADAMVPDLEASGITVLRNSTSDTAVAASSKPNKPPEPARRNPMRETQSFIWRFIPMPHRKILREPCAARMSIITPAVKRADGRRIFLPTISV